MKTYAPSVSQKLIWLDQAKSPDSAKYNIGGYAYLEGELSYSDFNRTLNDIIHSQEIYSTFFIEENFALSCFVEDGVGEYQIDVIDLTQHADPEREAKTWMENDFSIAFAVERNYLFKFVLLKISESKHFWYAKVHHLISDGFSFKLLLNQAAEIYDAYTRSEAYPLCNYQYSEYAEDDAAYYHSQGMAEDRAFWMEELKIMPAELFGRQNLIEYKTFSAGSDTLYLSKEVKAILEDAAKRLNASVFNILLAILLVYFRRVRGQENMIFAIPVLNRTKKKYRCTAGVFMNLLALNFSAKGGDTFSELVRSVKEKMSRSLRHQRYQYGNVRSDLNLSKEKHLYDVRISYEDFNFTSTFGGLTTGATALSNHQEVDKLAIYLREYHDSGYDVRFVYNKIYFDESMINAIKNGLWQMIVNLPSIEPVPIDQIDVIGGKERAKIIELSRGAVQDGQRTPFLTYWNAVVARTPEKICITCETGDHTYREINDRAIRLARVLSAGSSSPDRIALLLPRSEMMIIGILGAMMSGITYIPLDEDLPYLRVRYILEDAHCSCVLTSDKIKKEFIFSESTTVYMLEELLTKNEHLPQYVSFPFLSEKPAYIIYTSGSTGTPKGVSISNGSLCDYINTFLSYFSITAADAAVQQASIGFDTSVEEIFPVLAAGGRMHILGDRRDIFELSRIIEAGGVTILSSNPFVIGCLNKTSLPETLRIVISGGDVLHKEDVHNMLKGGIRVYNTYGPSESTVCTSYYPVKADMDVIPIGKPITNREMYILGDDHELLPIGVEGELYIGGAGLALEYVNNKALTDERFVPHFLNQAKKLYRTGDLCVLGEDGNFIFRGRKDDQLKYRGYRIEAGEIEKVLIGKGGIIQCVACVKELNGIPFLTVYAKTDNGGQGFDRNIKKDLFDWLPHYMIPDLIIPVEEFPLLISGKINRAVLPSIEAHMPDKSDITRQPPKSLFEKRLFEIWSDILRTVEFGIQDSFFDLGGNSLTAMQLLNVYYKTFHVRLTIRELFEQPTIGEQARVIESRAIALFKAIDNVLPAEDYQVSDGQRRLWVLSQTREGAKAYHLSGYLLLEGDYKPEYFEKAVRHLIMRHEILRTVFILKEDGELRQVVIPLENYRFTFEYADHRQSEAGYSMQYIKERSSMPFDLATGPLHRAGLVHADNNKFIFYYTMHHIISDGWSMELLREEVMGHYQAIAAGRVPENTQLRIQYKDFASWQREQLSSEAFEKHRSYWMQQLAGELPHLSLPFSRPRPEIMSNKGHELVALIKPEMLHDLKAVCQQHKCTLFMGLTALIDALLYLYSGQEEIIVGTPVAGRDHPDLEDQIGFYINTLILRTAIDKTDSFLALLQRVREVTLSAFSHQAYPFDRLVDDLQLPRDLTRSALFDVMLVLQNQPGRTSPLSGLTSLATGEIRDNGPLAVKLDLYFEFRDITEGLLMNVQYNSDLFEYDRIRHLVIHFIRLLELLSAFPDTPLSEVEYVSAEEKKTLLSLAGEHRDDYHPESFISLIQQQARSHPDDTAILCDDRKISYREVEELSSRLASFLRCHCGLQPQDIVAVLLNRDEWLIIALLGILKARGVYVGMDSDYPQERADYILRDSNCRLVFNEALLTAFKDQMDLLSADFLSVAEKEDPAYIIYTSGSSGQPKGVMIEHGNVDNFIGWCLDEFGGSDFDTVFFATSICFDLSIFEVFYSLSAGKKIRILKSALEIPELLGTSDKIALNTVPSVVGSLLDNQIDLSSVRVLNMAGEPIPPGYISLIDCDRIEVRNLYGPTETTTYSTVYRIRKDKAVAIGRPIANTEVYILNEKCVLQPEGVTGEIYIGGAGVARGYLNRAALTGEKFIANPFRHGGKLYKTGDLGRWMPDGNIEYHGRIDNQVKIRGYRIELGEIEDALKSYELIENAVVNPVVGEKGEPGLAAYLVCGGKLEAASIIGYLERTLPHYMIPHLIMQVDHLPLTPNGKIDRKRLPDLQAMPVERETKYVAPRNETETMLVKVWQEVLGKEPVGVKDNFFRIGGHSLKTAVLANRIKSVFGVNLHVYDLFEKAVLEEQSLLIQQAGKMDYVSIPRAPKQENYPLSSSQRRLWAISQLEGGNVAYHMPGLFMLRGALDQAALEYAFGALIERHEILRTVFKPDNVGMSNQLILPPDKSGFKIVYHDLSGEDDPALPLGSLIRQLYDLPFDLSTGPLFRCALYRLGEDKWVLGFVIHHIISDGWSINLLVTELLHFYDDRIRKRSKRYLDLPFQYKDYAVWQQAQLKSEAIKAHREYWLTRFEGEIPVLDMPADKNRPAFRTYRGHSVRSKLNAPLCNGIRGICLDQGATLYMGLLTAVYILLYRYTGNEDIIIGSPVAGRVRRELEEQIGLYLSILPLRTTFSGDNAYRQLLDKVKQVTIEALEHQEYPIDELLNELRIRRDLSRNALFDVMVILQNQGSWSFSGDEPGGLQVSPFTEYEQEISKFDLAFNFEEAGEELLVSIEYNADLFDQTTIERLLMHLERLIGVIIDKPDVAVKRLDYLTEGERWELLVKFNDTSMAYPADRTVIDVFCEQALRTPDAIAVIFEGRKLTYLELHERSDELALYLKAHYEVQPNDLVAIQLDRSEWMVIAMLGVLKSGAAFVPIDPTYPSDRIQYMLTDSCSKVAFNDQELLNFQKELYLYTANKVLSVHSPADLAYVIYTSGSTGRPKGVMIEHRGLLNMSLSQKKTLDLKEGEGTLQFASLSFDASCYEIFNTLLSGGFLLIPSKETILSTTALSELINLYRPSLAVLPPSFHALMEEVGGSFTTIVSAGEALKLSTAKKIIARGVHLINAYGPTEATICATLSHVPIVNNSRITIGKPVANTSIFILDADGHLVPVGVSGELYIGGVQLARGYLNKEKITADSFIPNPYRPGERMYRSGDLARWLPDGNIEFLGRKDDQVKVRGYRLELGEIESVLLDHPDIDMAVVVAVNTPTGSQLAGYITARIPLSVSELRSYLLKVLPSFMAPPYFVQLDEMPLTPNGKIDRKRLPDPIGAGLCVQAEYVAPRNHTDEKLVAFWQEILGRTNIGIRDDFFELGGHSIHAAQLLSRINAFFSVHISLQIIFSEPTIENLSDQISFLLYQGRQKQSKHKFVQIDL